MNVRSNAGVVACELCALTWTLAKWGGTAYIVFVLGHSAWWLLVPAFMSGWTCQYLTSPSTSNPESTNAT